MGHFSGQLDEAEWNFEKLPGCEVAPCSFYEYAREFATHSRRWNDLTTQLHNLRQLPKNDRRKRGQIKVIREILALFPCRPGNYLFCSPHFTVTPWIKLPSSERKTIAGEWEAELRQAASLNKLLSLTITLQRDLAQWAKSGVRNFEDWARLDSLLHGQGQQREYGFFAINWDYPDGHLIAEFTKWLKQKRGKQPAGGSQRGQNKQRQHLRALGAKRLLDIGFTAGKAMDYTERFLKDQNGNPTPLYDAPRSWSVAKTQIVPRVLEQLFSGPPNRP
jgi:hypothetical protein